MKSGELTPVLSRGGTFRRFEVSHLLSNHFTGGRCFVWCVLLLLYYWGGYRTIVPSDKISVPCTNGDRNRSRHCVREDCE